MRPTFHLVAEEIWAGLDRAERYRHESLGREGFIHCTDGADSMADTANRHYGDDARRFLVLTVDLDVAGSPWRIDEPGSPYPHVYGPIDRAAILEVRPMPRAPDGTFRPPR